LIPLLYASSALEDNRNIKSESLIVKNLVEQFSTF